MLALALVLDGSTRTEAAELCGMDRQTLRDWVHRYNDLGLSGLSNRVPPGAKPRLSFVSQAARCVASTTGASSMRAVAVA
jgi:transposase